VVERLVIVVAAEVAGLEELTMYAPQVLDEPSPLAAAYEEVIPLRQLEADYIGWVVSRCAGNKTRAAELLEIDVSTVYRRERGSGR
jgi:two-component system response regulator HydG